MQASRHEGMLHKILRPFAMPCSRNLTPIDWTIKIAIIACVAGAAPLAHWIRAAHFTIWGN